MVAWRFVFGCDLILGGFGRCSLVFWVVMVVRIADFHGLRAECLGW